jgi:hypothetical protein
MSATDELRRALPYAEAWGAASRSLAFRRIVELVVRAGGTPDPALRAEAFATLARLRPQVSAAARADAVRLATRHWPDPELLELLGVAPAEPNAPPAAALPIEPVPSVPAVDDAARSTDRLAERLRSAAHPAPPPADLVGDWRWECDGQGRFTFVEGDAPAQLERFSLFKLEGAEAIWPAFARQAPFRGVPAAVAGRRWSLAGVPYFDRGTGRFLGYRGTACALDGDGLLGSAASADALADVAHEVRSPLNAIMGFAQMIESETLGPAPEPYRERAGAILDNAHRLLGALDDLTDAARLDRGYWPLAPEPVDAGMLIERLAERHRPIAAAREVALAATVAPRLPAPLADPRGLDRALKRLLVAAIAVAEAGETLLLGAGRAGDRVQLYVTRPGALDDLSANDLYATADAGREGTAAPLLGLGFGLRLVRQLAEAMDGDFVIEPHRFVLSLAAAPDEQAVAKDDRSA